MKKTNFISKTIILLLFSSILVCSAPFKKENPLKGRTHEINLRNLELSTDNMGFMIIYSFCLFSVLIMGIIELCNLCRHNCDCEYEEKLPNKCIFLYFSLCGSLIVMIITIFVLEEKFIILSSFLNLGAFVISSIIFLVKCINNKKKYCTDICTMEYLKELAMYPCPYYCACCYITFPQEFWSAIAMLLMVVIYVVGSAIEYYLFLLFYMFLMLLTKIFSSCFSCKSGCNCKCCDCLCCSCCSCCCGCCHCCKCCIKKKEQSIPTEEQNDEQNDVCVTTLKAEAMYYESFATNESEINKNNNENNNEIEEVNAYEYENDNNNDNVNNNEKYNKISEGNVYENENDNNNDNVNNNGNYNKISEENVYENENGYDLGNNNNV